MNDRHARFRPSRTSLLLAAVCSVVLGSAGPIHAGIPDENGVIHACRHKQSGALRVIDSSATCNSATEVALNWSQAGAPASTDAYVASSDFGNVGAEDTTLASVDVPAGEYTVAAKTHLYNTAENSFAICELRAGAAVIDASILRLIAPANDQVVPFLGVAALPAGGTIALVCNGNGVDTVDSEATRLVATKVGALH